MADPITIAAMAAVGAGVGAGGGALFGDDDDIWKGALTGAVLGGAGGVAMGPSGSIMGAGSASTSTVGGAGTYAGTTVGGVPFAGSSLIPGAAMPSGSAASLLGSAGSAAPASTFLGLSSGQWGAVGMASNLMSGFGQMQSGAAMEQQYASLAYSEKTRAAYNEMARKERLLQALSSQNAARAAQGVRAYEGSPAAMMAADTESYYLERYADEGATSERLGQLGRSGQSAKNAGLLSAGASLLDFGAKAAMTQIG